MSMLCNEFRKGSAACFAEEVVGVKMGLNIGFEVFCVKKIARAFVF